MKGARQRLRQIRRKIIRISRKETTSFLDNQLLLKKMAEISPIPREIARIRPAIEKSQNAK